MVPYLLTTLQLADMATTHYVLKKRIGTEANPVLRWLFDQFSHRPVLLVIKGALIALLWWWAAPLIDERVVWALAAQTKRSARRYGAWSNRAKSQVEFFGRWLICCFDRSRKITAAKRGFLKFNARSCRAPIRDDHGRF